MFVGYADNHSSDNYRMMDSNTCKVIISQHVIWMNRLYGDPPNGVEWTLNDNDDNDDDHDSDSNDSTKLHKR